MEHQEIMEKVKKSICKILNINTGSKIEDDALLYEDLGIDSVDNIDLIVELEAEFAIELPTSELNYLKSIDSLVKQIEIMIDERKDSKE